MQVCPHRCHGPAMLQRYGPECHVSYLHRDLDGWWWLWWFCCERRVWTWTWEEKPEHPETRGWGGGLKEIDRRFDAQHEQRRATSNEIRGTACHHLVRRRPLSSTYKNLIVNIFDFDVFIRDNFLVHVIRLPTTDHVNYWYHVLPLPIKKRIPTRGSHLTFLNMNTSWRMLPNNITQD